MVTVGHEARFGTQRGGYFGDDFLWDEWLVDHSGGTGGDNEVYEAFVSKLDPKGELQWVSTVAIDDDSLKRLGRWPWSRRTHAELLDRLTAMQARAVGFDVLFAEQQTDDPLAGAIARNGKTVLAVAPSNPASGRPIDEVLPIAPLAESAAGLGHVDIELDTDGLCRSFYLRAGLGEAHADHPARRTAQARVVEARELIDQHWPAITAIAAYLTVDRQMSGEVAQVLFRRAMSPGAKHWSLEEWRKEAIEKATLRGALRESFSGVDPEERT